MEWPDLADLTPYDRNARQHPDGPVRAIARLIRAYDFDQPILIDEDDVVLKGKGRRRAALKFGLDMVPVIKAITSVRRRFYPEPDKPAVRSPRRGSVHERHEVIEHRPNTVESKLARGCFRMVTLFPVAYEL